MSKAKTYPEFRKKISHAWWLSNRRYAAYMMRELTSLFITIFGLLYIYQLSVLASRDASAYSNYLNLLRNPAMILFSLVILAFTLYHAFTWFYLTGKVQPIRIGKRTTTPLQALVVNTILLAIISYSVVRLFLLGS